MSTTDGRIAGYSLTETDEEWEEILAAFRALGGIADNIRRGRGGFGLHPIEPARPFRLHVPENLMFPVEDITFENDRIGLRETAGIPRPERRFFELYANILSWGGGGRQKCSALVRAFDVLPDDVRAFLVSEFGMAAWFDGEATERTRLRFLRSHTHEFGGTDVLIPILEIANPDSAGLQWRIENGVELAGQASGEILTSYGVRDPISVFERFALASREPVAFSLPMRLKIGPIDFVIARSFETAQLRGVLIPRLLDTGTELELSFLMLGNPKHPRLPRGTFRVLMKPFGLKNADEEFDGILHANWTKFLGLLGVLETHQGELIVSLRNMAQYQLEALSCCIGAREI